MEEIREDELELVSDGFRMLPRFITEENHDDKYKLPPLAEQPWLIATHENYKANKLEKQVFRTNLNSYVKTILELDRNIILAAHQGWLILRDREDYTIYSLWNPVTSQFLQLPKLELELELEDDIKPSVCVLTSSLDLVNNPETCLLVLFFQGGLMFSCTPTLSLDFSWVKQYIEFNGSVLDITIADTIEGVIYAEGYISFSDGAIDRKFVCIKNINNNGSSSSLTVEPMNIDRPSTKIGCDFMILDHINHMVESCGELYYITIMARVDGDDYKSLDIVKVKIWKFDFSHMDWNEVESLRNRAFLLGTSCTWCWADTSTSSSPGQTFIEENCVYLARPDDDKVYSYNLNDDSCTILLPHPSFITSYYGPIWYTASDHQGPLSGSEANQLINETSEHIVDINQEFEDTQELPSGTVLFELPLDIIESIAQRINLFDYMNLRLTCKRLYKVNPISQWRASSHYPLFLYPKDRTGTTYEMLDPFQNISRPISIPHTSPNVMSSIEYCKDGWLLVKSENYSVRYMYPFTFAPDTWKYPSCEEAVRIGFSSSPTSSDSRTVAILAGYWQSRLLCRLEGGNGEWENCYTEFEPDKDINFRTNYKTGPTYHNNAFYFLGRDGCLGEFKCTQGETTWHVYKHPFYEDEDAKFDSCYLVEVDGELVSVFIKNTGRYIEVFKFDASNNCWIELDTLGEHILFLSSASSYSLKTDNTEIANRIYLPRRFGNGIVFLSLNTWTYHTSDSTDSRDYLYGTKAQSSCCWLW